MENRNTTLGYGAYAYQTGTISIGASYRPSLAICIGNTLLPTSDDSIHIGHDLLIQANLNIGDIITGDKNDVTVSGSINPLGGINGIHVRDVSCDICISDEELDARNRVRSLKSNPHPTTSEQEYIDSYIPTVKPGFNWGTRSMCLDCMFESAFDFAAKMRLQKY